VTHRASVRFWGYYQRLPEPIRRLVDENFKLLKENPKPEIRMANQAQNQKPETKTVSSFGFRI